MSQKIKCRIYEGTILILSLIIICCIVQPIYLLKGYHVFRIPSGSMSPTIKPASIVLVENKPNYNIGDIIAYKNSKNKTIIHRIIDVNNGIITTKGDNNDFNDASFYQGLIFGKVTRIFSLESIVFYSCLFCVFLFISFYIFRILFGRKIDAKNI